MQQIFAFRRITATLARFGLDGFLLALLAAVGLAYVYPYPGTSVSPLHLAQVANYGVSLIFFFYGLRLSPEKLRAGLGNWRLHTLVQATTFLFFPLLVLALHPLFSAQRAETLWLGVFFLAALPSTVSSSVVMVSVAGGNLPAAIFNASVSSLLGVVLTPLWMGLVLQASGDYALGPAIGKLAWQVLLPVVLGLLLHRRWGDVAEWHKRKIRMADQSVILLIVYTSFCESFTGGVFDGYGLPGILALGAGMVALFFTAYGTVYAASNWLGFSREDRVTALFCGSKKSLVQGAVMSKVLFPAAGQAGLLLLPLMLYHALQLLVVSVLANAEKVKSANQKP
ncbi:MAG: bile acid:sodium symporter [Cytophagales bacterium]|nr:bile acid:sodium symporter [Cytophagales bacterium]